MTDPSASPASAEAVAAAPSPSEVIRSWLPDHTHVDLPPGPFNLSPVTAWTWTTAAGVWKLTWSRGFGGTGFQLACPGGRLKFGGVSGVALRQIHGVLVALDAIDGEATR
jgi:hypothetical protein